MLGGVLNKFTQLDISSQVVVVLSFTTFFATLTCPEQYQNTLVSRKQYPQLGA